MVVATHESDPEWEWSKSSSKKLFSRRAAHPPSINDREEIGRLIRIIAVHGEIAKAKLEPRSVANVVCARAQELTQSAGAVVELLEGSDMLYWAASGKAAGQIGVRLKANTSLSGMCVRTGKVMRCDDSETDPRVDREACRRVGLRSMLVVPLRHNESAVGVLKVLSPIPGAYGPGDMQTLQLMATLVGATLAHAMEHDAFVHEARDKESHHEIESLDRAPVVARIRNVIDRDLLDMVFQPIINLRSMTIDGFEALARFKAGPIRTPNLWFADAHKVGLGAELELMAIKKALAAMERLPKHAYLSVNVSPTTVSPELENLIDGVETHRIVLEVTEHESVENYAELAANLAPLREVGTRLSIDDAGAGFASLRHILLLEPDIIKLDIALTRRIDSTPKLQSLASAMVLFAAGTAATITAEGIESHSELDALRSLGVDDGQGYYLGRPGPLAAA